MAERVGRALRPGAGRGVEMIRTATETPDPSKPVTTAGTAASALEACRIRLVQLAGGPLPGQLERLEGVRVVDVDHRVELVGRPHVEVVALLAAPSTGDEQPRRRRWLSRRRLSQR
jgi:hypothetical protein